MKQGHERKRRRLADRFARALAPRASAPNLCDAPLKGAPMKGIAMTSRAMKTPGPDHPIAIAPNPGRVIVSLAGRVIADTTRALALRESSYPAALYIPREDVDMTLLARTDHATYCPYKGECAYYSIPLGGARSVNAVWTYEAPYASVAEIKDHLAFYPDRVDAIETRPAG
jgi:uncharacterized protein (DUF427 family)